MEDDEYLLACRLSAWEARDILDDGIERKSYFTDFYVRGNMTQETAALLVLVKDLIERVEELECIVEG